MESPANLSKKSLPRRVLSVNDAVRPDVQFQPPAVKLRRCLRRTLSGDSIDDMDDELGFPVDPCQCDTCFLEDDDGDSELRRKSSASWRKLRNVMIWAPFIQQYQRHRYPWIQLAGHQGNFRAGEQGTILKKHCYRECTCLKALMEDQLRPYIPEFKGEVVKDNERYVCMQDLLMEFESPSLMDCKLGLRTYLEEELTNAKSNPTPRKDMYEKMIEVDPCEPTECEHQMGAVTKPRYMQWRETLSSTATLGFRIEGIKKAVAKSNNDFKRLKSRDDVKACLKDFTDGNVVILERYLTRLRSINSTLEGSEFFKKHELIGSSLLFVHDHRCKVNIWMIDFGKTMPLPEGVSIDHRSEWIEGNHEDGYLFGLGNMTTIFEELLAETSVSSSLNQFAASTLMRSDSVNSHSTIHSVSRDDS